MKNVLIENLAILTGSVAFYVFFWGEKMGINVLLFSILLIGILYAMEPEIRKSRAVIWTSIGTLLTAILVVWNNSMMSKTIHLLSFICLLGFAKQRELRFLCFAFLLPLVTFFSVPKKIFRRFSPVGAPAMKLAPVWRNLRLSIVPLLVLGAFYMLYSISNPKFNELSDQFWSTFFNWLSWDINWGKVSFFLLGTWLTGMAILRTDFPVFRRSQAHLSLQLKRLRGGYHPAIKGMISLKSEYRTGMIMIVSLNLLLFLVNGVEIYYHWFETPSDFSPRTYKTFVHEGTYLLIFSILLAMGVLLYFFRKNINFLPNNEPLKAGAYLWIIQNGILAFSLLLRNYGYIAANGLAYKRIGVMIFLLCVFFGLATMWMKIAERKSAYFLYHLNSWGVYVILICCSFINWDTLITRHNLRIASKVKVDYPFLIQDVSDKNLYLLLAHRIPDDLPTREAVITHNKIQYKKYKFERKQARYSWLSWNYPDAKNLDFLAQQALESKNE